MASYTVGQRESHFSMAPAAELTLNYFPHGHLILALCRHKDGWMAHFTFKPPCMYIMWINHIIGKVAFCFYHHIHVHGREFIIRRVEGRSWRYDVIFYCPCP